MKICLSTEMISNTTVQMSNNSTLMNKLDNNRSFNNWTITFPTHRTRYLEQQEGIIYWEEIDKMIQDLLDTTLEHVLINDIITMKMKRNKSNKGHLREEVQLKMLRKCSIIIHSETMIWVMEEREEKETEWMKRKIKIS